MGNRPHCDNGEGGGFHATPLPSTFWSRTLFPSILTLIPADPLNPQTWAITIAIGGAVLTTIKPDLLKKLGAGMKDIYPKGARSQTTLCKVVQGIDELERQLSPSVLVCRLRLLKTEP